MCCNRPEGRFRNSFYTWQISCLKYRVERIKSQIFYVKFVLDKTRGTLPLLFRRLLKHPPAVLCYKKRGIMSGDRLRGLLP